MMMCDQESNFLQQIQDEDICRSMLKLSTVSDQQSSSAADAYPSASACTCSAKRQSPTSLQQPPPKRPTPSPLEDHNLLGYKKLPLAPPPLRRTFSEPIYSEAPPPQLPPFSTSPKKIQVQESYPFPKPSPLLHRTASDPNAGRLKRMKERLREMSQWALQVSNEEHGDETVESGFSGDLKKDECEQLPQEAVFVEKGGECLVLHFKCPCGHGYQILLSGDTCYYKLTTLPD